MVCRLPLYPITMGTLLDCCVLSIRTASFAAGFVVVVEVVVVVVDEVSVGVASSHSNESHGHPAGQFSLIIVFHSIILIRPTNFVTMGVRYKL